MKNKLFENKGGNIFTKVSEIAFAGQDVVVSEGEHLNKLMKELGTDEYTLGFGKGSDGWYLLTTEDEQIYRDEFPEGGHGKQINDPKYSDKPFTYFSMKDIMNLYECEIGRAHV